MTEPHLPPPGPGARILNFRRDKPPSPSRPPAAAPGLEKFERDTQPDDYRHRMLVNIAAFGVLVLLVVGGYWLADTMARMRKDQDCVLSGRRNCSAVSVEDTRNRR